MTSQMKKYIAGSQLRELLSCGVWGLPPSQHVEYPQPSSSLNSFSLGFYGGFSTQAWLITSLAKGD